MSVDDAIKQTVLQILEEKESTRIPRILTAKDVEELTEGKINKQKFYDLARNADKNGFPVMRLGGRDVKVLDDRFVEWMRNGGVPLDDDE